MPLIDVTYPAGAIQPAEREALLATLTGTILQWEGAPDTEFFRSVTWVYAHELPGGTLAAGGSTDTAPRFRIDVTVPEGALSERRKEGLVADVTREVLAAAGLAEADSLRVFVLIDEVPEGNWGAAGNIVRFEALREAAAAERAKAEAAEPAPAGSAA